MPLQENLSAARLAIRYVQEKMTVGAGNKFGDLARSMGGSFLCVAASRSVHISIAAGGVPGWIREAAAKAENVGCGNCGEQAALAFICLHDQHHTHPLEYMERTNRDHAFVVAGRARGSVLSDHTTWGKDAVVCDPWDGKVYPASEIPTKAYGGARPSGVRSRFRIE